MYLLHFVLKLEDLVKVAKTNYVVMKLAADGHKHDSQVNIVYAFYLGRSFSGEQNGYIDHHVRARYFS